MNVSTLIAATGVHAPSSGGDTNSFLLVVGGAAVGGVISLGTTLVVEWWRGRALRQAKQKDESTKTKLACRLVHLELQETQSVLKLALARKPFRWPPSAEHRFGVSAWQRYAPHLAAQLPREDWELVATPYSLFEYANLSAEGLTERSAKDLHAAGDRAIEVVSARLDEPEAPLSWKTRTRSRLRPSSKGKS